MTDASATYPPMPWPEAVEPPVEELADWLRSMDRDQLVAFLSERRAIWHKDSECFIRDHDGRIEHAERIIKADADAWQQGYNRGFEDAGTLALQAVLGDQR